MKNKKTIIRWVSLLLLIMAVIGVTVVGAAEPAPKEADGLILENMPIVLPAGATDVEKSAAKELQHYLKEITGKSSSIVTETVGLENAIYIGATKFAAANNMVEKDEAHPDGLYVDKNDMDEWWAYKGIDNNLVVTGGEVRGVLYGVYHLLEDEFGVHWWNFWEEYVPEMDSAVLPYSIDRSGEPVFAYRDVFATHNHSSLVYVRNRMNGYGGKMAPAAYGAGIEYGMPYHVHTFNRYFPPFYKEPTNVADQEWLDAVNPDGLDWFEEHEDWYIWDKAQQKWVASFQMCLTNEELMKAFADKVCASIKLTNEARDKAGKPRAIYFDVSPNDLEGLCECDNCTKAIKESGPSGRLLKFVNKVAEYVELEYPEVFIETLAYSDYLDVPLDDTVPRHNVVIRIANSDFDALHDYSHPNNEFIRDRLEDWSKILEPYQMILWDYDLLYAMNGVAPTYFRIGPDYQMFHKLGGSGVFTEIEDINECEFWDMRQWVLVKLLEDPYQDQDELIMTFLKGYYGEAAAKHIFGYMEYWHDEVQYYDEVTFFDDPILDAPWLTVDRIMDSYHFFEDAQKALEEDDSLTDSERELFLKRLDVGRAGYDRAILYNYYDFVDEMAERGETFPINRQEVGVRMIAAMQWLFDMELENDYTGVQSVPKRGSIAGSTVLSEFKEFVGETDTATGEIIDRPEIPQQILDDHPGIDPAHIHDFNFSNLWNAYTVQGHPALSVEKYGASYPGGSAIVYEQENIIKSYPDLFEYYYTFSETKGLPGTLSDKLRLNDPIIADGEWHLYRAEDVVVLGEGITFIDLFGSTTRANTTKLTHLENDPVDVYISMKVTGDPSGKDPKNYAKIYVDRILIVEDCSVYHKIQYNSVNADGMKTGVCPVCGKELVKQCDAHSSTNYTYNAAEKTYEGTCDSCGLPIAYEVTAKLPDAVMEDIKNSKISLGHLYDFDYYDDHPSVNGQDGIHTLSTSNVTIVDDDEASLGKAILLDVAKTVSPPIWFIKEGGSMEFGQYNRQSVATSIPYAELKANANKGYHTYKLDSFTVRNCTFVYGCLFFRYDNSIRSYEMAETLKALEGKQVDLYINMKIEGDITGATGKDNYAKYYIDRWILVESCENYTYNGYEVTTPAGCGKNAIESGECAKCGCMHAREVEGSALPHTIGSYKWDEQAQNFVGVCTNCGESVTAANTLDAALPEDLMTELNENKIGLKHVYDFPANLMQRVGSDAKKNPWNLVNDPDSPHGKAMRLEAKDATSPRSFIVKPGESFYNAMQKVADGVLSDFTYEQMKPNEGKGYKVYKLELTYPTTYSQYFSVFSSTLVMYNHMWWGSNSFRGHDIDLYVSLKIEGELETNPIYYVDRFIIVDPCDNYEFEFVDDGTGDCDTPSNLIGTCPVCEATVIKPGTGTGDHSFTNYVRRDWKHKYEYIATCDYGCGAIDIKEDPRYSMGNQVEKLFHEEMPESARKHVVAAYSAKDLRYTKEQGYIWDLELDQPVVKRAYEDQVTQINKDSMFVTRTTGIPLCWYPKGAYPSYEFGEISGQEIIDKANTGKYELFAVKGVKPVTLPAYNYFYMFPDWDMQSVGMVEDLEPYRDQVLDFYFTMKVDGDPAGGTANKPDYSIFSIIVTQSCVVDDTWTITKEPTCTEPGEAVGNCSVCGLQNSVVTLPMKAHNIPDGIVFADPTCRDDRIMKGKCVECGKNNQTMIVEGTSLQCEFTNFVLQEDGVTEIAYCDLGCGERMIRTVDRDNDIHDVLGGVNDIIGSVTDVVEDIFGIENDNEENTMDMLPILGGAGGGDSQYYNGFFTDVTESDWYYEEVKEAWENGLIDGVTAAEYRPNETLTVAQAIKLAAAFHEMYFTGSVSLKNGSTNWYDTYVTYATEARIIDSKYASYSAAQMNKAIDRAEFVSIFVNAMNDAGLVGYNSVADNAIPDVKMDDEAAEAIYKFYRAGILTGSDAKGTFNPESSIKRSEVAAILSRMYNEGSRQAITLG